jgi:hypothetical protein
VSYFRPQKAGKIGPRTVHSFSDSTSRLSQNAGQVMPAKCALSECLKLRVQSTIGTLAQDSYTGSYDVRTHPMRNVFRRLGGILVAWTYSYACNSTRC